MIKWSLEVTVQSLAAMVLFLHSASSWGQIDSGHVASTGNTVYLGILGNGWLYSVNYDHSWRAGRTGLSLSIGGGYVPDQPGGPDVSKYSVPVQFNIFHGRHSTMEHGTGLTYGSGWNATTAQGGSHSEELHLFLKPIGFRYQRGSGGVFIRASALIAIKLVEFRGHLKNS